MVKDIHTETGMTIQEELTFPLGGAYLGNHVVADTCGLVARGMLGNGVCERLTQRQRPFVINPPPLAADTAWNEDERPSTQA